MSRGGDHNAPPRPKSRTGWSGPASWFRREIWNIGLVRQSAASIVTHGLTAPVQWLAPAAAGTFVADPCAVALPDGDLLVVAEHLSYDDFKGVLVQGTAAAGEISTLSLARSLEMEGHLSYPTLVRWQDEWLLLAECWESHGIPVHRAKHPGGPWQPAAVMLPGVQAVDPTAVEHEGRWYLFLTRRDDGPDERLRLFHAPTPLGPWQPHARAVIVEGPAGARPAGPLFRLDDGTLVRPGQDCSTTYGGAVMLYRVDVLTPGEYRETLIRRVEPPPGPWGAGLHTLCPAGPDHVLVDGKRWEYSPIEPLRRLARLPAVRARRRRAAS